MLIVEFIISILGDMEKARSHGSAKNVVAHHFTPSISHNHQVKIPDQLLTNLPILLLGFLMILISKQPCLSVLIAGFLPGTREQHSCILCSLSHILLDVLHQGRHSVWHGLYAFGSHLTWSSML